MNKFLILGGKSKLAESFIEFYKDQCQIVNKNECDITDKNNLKNIIKNSNCNYVINFAAITDVDYCENNSKECFRVNSLAPKDLSKICKKYDKKLILFSSNYAVRPKNAYGRSKNEMEKIKDKNVLIIRTDFYSNKTYVVKKLLEGEYTFCYKNVFINPVSINRLAKEIYVNRDKTGILNIFSSIKMSWFDFAVNFCKSFKIDNKLVIESVYKDDINGVVRPTNAYVKSDIIIDIIGDLKEYGDYIKNKSLDN